MNNQKKGVLSHVATLLSVNFGVLKGFQEWLLRWTIACVVLALCHKEHFKNRNIIKQHIRFLAVTAVLE
jgi:hypothetical protein